MGKIKSRRGAIIATAAKTSAKRPRAKRTAAAKPSAHAAPALSRMRFAGRQMQRRGVRVWEGQHDQWHAVQRAWRLRRSDWSLRARRQVRRNWAGIVGLIADVSREARRDMLRRLRSADRLVRRKIDDKFSDAGHALDRLLQPTTRTFRPLERATIAAALAALAVALVSVAWLVVYSQTPAAPTPTPVVSAPVAPAAPPKEFTERAVTPAFANIDLAGTTAKAPAEAGPDAALAAAQKAAPVTVRDKITRARAERRATRNRQRRARAQPASAN